MSSNAMPPAASQDLERQARVALDDNPADERSLRALSKALYDQGRAAEADAAARDAALAALRTPSVSAAVAALTDDDLQRAEALIRQRLRDHPDEPISLLMMGDLAQRLGIFDQAEQFLRQAATSAPVLDDAWFKLGEVLHELGRTNEGLACFDEAIGRSDNPVPILAARIRAQTETGDYEGALQSYDTMYVLAPDDPATHVGMGNTLRTVGRRDEAIKAYRQAIELDERYVEAWWSLSNMKVGALDDHDVRRIERILADEAEPRKRLYLDFALGKALEDRADYAASFSHYAAGNAERRALVPHSRDAIERRVDEAIAFFSADFFHQRSGWGEARPDPIFIIGMPRSGSTLLEQILASHPLVEGTAELPMIPALPRKLVAEQWRDRTAHYPDLLANFPEERFTEVGCDYLLSAARHRKSDRPYFIDKMPFNWMHIGLIQLILPNATIIDARRDAMSCCFANFKQHFPGGQSHAYNLTDVGHQYRQYVRLVDHFDHVLPGRVIPLSHEDLLADPERVIRTLLERIGLPFAESCLMFHENKRPVRTPSAEQVRRPINRDAVNLWRNYEPWLGELKTALGDLGPA